MDLSLLLASTTVWEELGFNLRWVFILGSMAEATSSVDLIRFSYTSSMLSEFISVVDRDWNLLEDLDG